MKIKAVYDLSALMVALENEGPPTELTAAIRRAADVSSAHRDLDEALAAIKLLWRLTSGWDETHIEDSDLTTIVGSLMSATIILYARATITSSDARRPWFGEGRLPKVLRPTHDGLIRLRNKEVAHFGRGHPVDGTPPIRGSTGPTTLRSSASDRPSLEPCPQPSGTGSSDRGTHRGRAEDRTSVREQATRRPS